MILLILIVAAIAGFAGYRIYKGMSEKNRKTWVVPVELLDSILPEIEAGMIADGFGMKDYNADPSRGPVKICTNFAIVWQERIKKALKPHCGKNEDPYVMQFSFRRDIRSDGSDPGSHRVVAVMTTEGMRYVDTYRINGTLYRTLSAAEQANGEYR